MTYVFEKGSAMALCGVKDDTYFNYKTGEMIDNPKIVSYISKGIKNKSLSLIEADLKFCEIIDPKDEIFKVVGFNYLLNNSINLLNENMQPFQKEYAEFIKSKLSNGEYIQKIIWGDSDE